MTQKKKQKAAVSKTMGLLSKDLLLKNPFKNTVLYAGLDREEYESLQNDMTRLNLISLKGITTITAGYMVVMFASSFRNWVTNANILHFIWCFCLSVGILAAAYLGAKTRTATLIAVYAFLGTIFSYGIAIGCTQTSQTAVSFLIYIMVGPLLFYDKPLRLNCFVWLFIILFLVACDKLKTPEARDTDFVNAVSYGVISSLMTTGSMVLKVKRVWLEKKLQTMADTDTLTDLKNRNCFDREYRSYAEKARKTVACIYIDANGLHALNNTQGHEAGDRMLRYLADQLTHLFGKESTYRAGGDEFMVFCCDEEETLLQQKITELTNHMKEKQYSVSVGMISAPAEGLEIDDLIKQADAQMYIEKKRYYEQNGIERRKQRKE